MGHSLKLAPFSGAPTYMTLNSLNSHINACDVLVQYDLGGVNLGYLVLTAPPATYTLLSTLPFVEPTIVGPTLTIPGPAPTALVLSELVQTHAENLRVCQEYNDVDRAIKRVNKTIVTKPYIWTLQSRHTGYATVRSLDILTHLHATYGMLEYEDIQAIDTALKFPINEETHFEDRRQSSSSGHIKTVHLRKNSVHCLHLSH